MTSGLGGKIASVLGTGILVLVSAIGSTAGAEDRGDSPANSPGQATAVERRLHEELQRVLLRLVESGELAAEQAEELSLLAPASRLADFGAILDVRANRPDPGLDVLGVTPGGSAEQLGVRAGDRLVAVNQTDLGGSASDPDGRLMSATLLREALLETPDSISLQVRRNGELEQLEGSVRVVELPAYRLELGAALANATLAAAGDGVSSCGRVSVFDIAPRRQKLHRAILIAIDGSLPGPTMSDSFRVSPGRHVLTVAEAIDSRYLGGMVVRERGRTHTAERYKTLLIDVQPGITYRLAAKLNPDRLAQGVKDLSYWQPVIWRESPETCR